jgi:hypothetical protein
MDSPSITLIGNVGGKSKERMCNATGTGKEQCGPVPRCFGEALNVVAPAAPTAAVLAGRRPGGPRRSPPGARPAEF